MTQEDKELLLKDLCARLPYGVKCLSINNKNENILSIILRIDVDEDIVKVGTRPVKQRDKSMMYIKLIEYTKPYLRSMDSMTKEERKEYLLTWKDEPLLRQVKTPVTESDDWLEAHHFDYRGLIEKGLALEAPEDMYKN